MFGIASPESDRGMRVIILVINEQLVRESSETPCLVRADVITGVELNGDSDKAWVCLEGSGVTYPGLQYDTDQGCSAACVLTCTNEWGECITGIASPRIVELLQLGEHLKRVLSTLQL